jgi:serine protease Do/serine protease DegQ
MTRFIHFLIIPLYFVFSTSNAALPAFANGEELPSLAPMLEEVQPAIVNISTTTVIQAQEHPLMQDPFFRKFFNVPKQQRPSSSLGSGVIVNANKGYVITNHHVIDKADEITITTKDGRELKARLVGSDPASDIAVVQVEAKQLTDIAIGSSEKLRVGDFVVAIGSPFGLSQTVTSGIVSALGRSGLGIEGYEDFIQTDASINPGNSGGALVNLRGELVGINTAILSRGGGSVGIGLSIPVDMVVSLMEQLVEHGEVKRGLLGVRMQDLTPSLADAFGISGKKGAVVSDVIPGSAAEEKGMKEGDVIVRFNDTDVESGADLRNAVGLLRPGSNAKVEFYRDGKLESVKVKIKDFDDVASVDENIIQRLQGGRFKNLPPESDFDKGVLVAAIEPGSPAASSGLEENDIIISINREEVADVDDMKRIVKASSDVLLIKLIRNNRSLFLVVQ